MKYRAVIFDMDGTLLNTLRDLADAVNKGLEQMGFPTHDLESYKYFVGEGREIMAKKTLPEDHRDRQTVDKLVDLINVEYGRSWVEHTRPYPGVPDLLNALTDIRMRMAILSNKPHDSPIIWLQSYCPNGISNIYWGPRPTRPGNLIPLWPCASPNR